MRLPPFLIGAHSSAVGGPPSERRTPLFLQILFLVQSESREQMHIRQPRATGQSAPPGVLLGPFGQNLRATHSIQFPQFRIHLLNAQSINSLIDSIPHPPAVLPRLRGFCASLANPPPATTVMLGLDSWRARRDSEKCKCADSRNADILCRQRHIAPHPVAVPSRLSPKFHGILGITLTLRLVVTAYTEGKYGGGL
jgi:hypothetical protein